MARKATKRQIFPTITQAFLNRARSSPEKDAFFSKEAGQWIPVSWGAFQESVRKISLALMELGLRSGDRAGIVSDTRIEWAACDMAILGAGAITVPVYASNTAEETAYILGHCEAEVVFVEDNRQLDKVLSLRDRLPRLRHLVVFNVTPSPAIAERKDVLSLSALRELGRRAADPDRFERNLMAARPEDVFTICYTSGTTGVPKGAVLTFDNLASVIEDVERVMGEDAGESDIVLSFLPLSHIFGKVESMAAYHFGWQTYYAESIEKLLSNMAEVRPTLLFAVPRVFEKAYNRIIATTDESSFARKRLFEWALAAGRGYFGRLWEGKPAGPATTAAFALAWRLVLSKVYARFGGRVRYCIAGGAPLPKEIGEFMRIVGVTVLEGYGLTETCAPVTVNTPSDVRFGTIGKPLPEVALKIAEDGEILVKSRKVFREYYKNPEATAEALDAGGWFHTGDIGIIEPDGFVRVTDRKKDLIVMSGGKNIAPQKIESLAKTHKFISQLVVHGDQRNFLTALVVLEKEDVIRYARENHILFSEYSELVKHPKVQGLVQRIIDEVNAKLASFETIKRFRVLPNEFTIETGELTPSLKIRRRFCSEKYRAVLDGMYGGEAPP